MWIELPMEYGFIVSGAILSHYPTQEVSFRKTTVSQRYFFKQSFVKNQSHITHAALTLKHSISSLTDRP